MSGHAETELQRCMYERCRKFAQHVITYKLNAQLLTYCYCPPHSREVQAALQKLNIVHSVSAIPTGVSHAEIS